MAEATVKVSRENPEATQARRDKVKATIEKKHQVVQKCLLMIRDYLILNNKLSNIKLLDKVSYSQFRSWKKLGILNEFNCPRNQAKVEIWEKFYYELCVLLSVNQV